MNSHDLFGPPDQRLTAWQRAAGYDLAIKQDQDRREHHLRSGQAIVHRLERNPLRGREWAGEESDSNLILMLAAYVVSLAMGAGLLWWAGRALLAWAGVGR